LRPRAGLKSKFRRPLDRTIDLVEERGALREKTAPSTKIALRSLWQSYRRLAASGKPLPAVWDTGFRVFSQFDEDGVMLFLLAVAAGGTGRFVDIGADDGVSSSNTANLALNFGFDGLFIEANAERAAKGERFYARHPDTRERPPLFRQAFVTREEINDLISSTGIEGEIDVLSIDIDGNDYWIWESLVCVQPRLVVVEAHTELGLAEFVSPYDRAFDWRRLPPGDPIGASVVSFTQLATRLGYRLVGANLYGFNLFFIREDLGTSLPTVEPAEAFRHASYRRDPALADAAAGSRPRHAGVIKDRAIKD
jgi:hypothetical protein